MPDEPYGLILFGQHPEQSVQCVDCDLLRRSFRRGVVTMSAIDIAFKRWFYYDRYEGPHVSSGIRTASMSIRR